MNAIVISTIQNTAREFAKIAKRVNILSRLRTNHSKEALVCIIHIRSIGSELIEDLNNIANKNINQRDNDVKIKTTCEKLAEKAADLSGSLTAIEKDKLLNTKIVEQLKTINSEFQDAVSQALELITIIISRDDEIIVKDNEILGFKNAQQTFLEKLYSDTQKSCSDAEKAVEGSHSNLERGLKMVENFENLETLLKNKNTEELNKLLSDINRGWNIAVEVNKSSIPQLEFAEKVNEYTKELHDESMRIKDLVISRHKYFAESLRVFSDLSVILSGKFKIYTELGKIMHDTGIEKNKKEHVANVVSQIKAISEAADSLILQNNDMIITSHYYTENAAKTVDMTKEEIDYFDKIIEEIEFMTETTRYPIEGSNNNITNGQILEQLLINTLTENNIPFQEIE